MNFLGYIDPGTGSMLFTIVIGIVTALFFALRGILIKMKFVAHGGGGTRGDSKKIPIVIFTDSKRYWNVFKPICDEMEKRGIRAEYWTASPDDPALGEQYEFIKCQFIGEGNKAFAKLNIMNAYICLATTPGLDVLQWKRSKNVNCYVHTSHALDDGTLYRMFGMDFFDCVLASGENMVGPVRELETMRGLPEKEVVVTGVTYMDEMMARWNALRKEWGQDKKPGTENEKIILCAPSWGTNCILNRFGEKFLQALTDTGYKIIIRPHPQSATSDPELMAELKRKFPESDRLEWNYDNDNFDVLSRADLLISDFSGITFDYCFVFDRPVIYADTHFDTQCLDADWFGEDFVPWILASLGKIGRELKEEDFPDMKRIIDEVLTGESYRLGREKCREEAWAHRGEATVRIVDFLENKLDQLTGKDEDRK